MVSASVNVLSEEHGFRERIRRGRSSWGRPCTARRRRASWTRLIRAGPLRRAARRPRRRAMQHVAARTLAIFPVTRAAPPPPHSQTGGQGERAEGCRAGDHARKAMVICGFAASSAAGCGQLSAGLSAAVSARSESRLSDRDCGRGFRVGGLVGAGC